MVTRSLRAGGAIGVALVAFLVAWTTDAGATSQWSRKTGSECNRCHTVFPRLNPFGEQFLRNGYVLEPSHRPAEGAEGEEEESGGLTLPKIDHILGFRLNLTALQLETHSLQRDSLAEKSSRWTFGNPNWIQFFVAGSVQPHVSFFSELEYAQSAFKFNWFYFNLTRLGQSSALNAQVGNISPLEFASVPNRLPQLPAIKGEVFLVKSSNGAGEASVDMSSARPGIQYYGYNDWILGYAGVSSGPKATQVNQYLNGWAGAVLKLPDGKGGGFEGSTATLHYYAGTDTKNTGPTSQKQLTNGFTRLSPQLNIRYDERLDVQAAYVIAKDKNRSLVASPTEDFEYSGVALEAGYMPRPTWHLGIHYDKYESDNEFTTGPNIGKPVLEYHRIVPALTYVLNENIRGSLYWEHDLTDKASEDKVDKVYFNVRAMF
jgi:hypothetical protein